MQTEITHNPLQIEDLLVVKIGGGAGLDMDRCIQDLARLAAARPLVIVHGVSERMNHLCVENGVPVRTLTSPDGHSSRYTDAVTRDFFAEAASQINHEMVAALRGRGIRALGSFADSIAIHGRRKGAIRAVVNGRVRIVRDDYSGSITSVENGRLYDLLRLGYTPVLPPVARSQSDGLLNIDGDRAAAAVAAALGARDMVILSNVPGLYRDPNGYQEVVTRVSAREINEAMAWAQGRMKRKVLSASEALDGGVRRVVIADGRIDNPVERALSGAGTEFVA